MCGCGPKIKLKEPLVREAEKDAIYKQQKPFAEATPVAEVIPIFVDVERLQLQKGDILVATVPETYGELDGHISEQIAAAFERALKNAGHFDGVGAVYLVGQSIELKIVRPEPETVEGYALDDE